MGILTSSNCRKPAFLLFETSKKELEYFFSKTADSANQKKIINQRVRKNYKEAEKNKKMTIKEEETIKKRKAQHALEEIYQSEKKYVDKLNSIVESLMMPALQNSSIFSSSEIGLLFGNIVELRNLHSSMFSAFEEGKNPEKLAKIISEELPQFSI